jgi:hypothetical protein
VPWAAAYRIAGVTALAVLEYGLRFPTASWRVRDNFNWCLRSARCCLYVLVVVVAICVNVVHPSPGNSRPGSWRRLRLSAEAVQFRSIWLG